jgi:hypothetical protein
MKINYPKNHYSPIKFFNLKKNMNFFNQNLPLQLKKLKEISDPYQKD